MKNYVLPEPFPEGPYGSPINRPLGKSTPWKPGQRSYSAFTYENKNLHQNLPRKFPGAHPTHDDPDKNEEPPYTSG
ncbi:cytosolic protein [Bacillus alkalicellulosilyticus]|uniref:cytosolic protein n=1 Tax=Alkalihalobacterium alkalicellulosilyticum TaxID=1912214 RepID=UPI0009963E78|nr:cytosolic protein [Bacillus alkalicellulosilyticus]